MGTKKEIWQKIDRRTGLTEPDEAYFEQFASRIMEQLPEMEQPKAQPVSLWTRLQPWIYMAAMFAGVPHTSDDVMVDDGTGTAMVFLVDDFRRACASRTAPWMSFTRETATPCCAAMCG